MRSLHVALRVGPEPRYSSGSSSELVHDRSLYTRTRAGACISAVQGCMIIMGVTRFHEAQSDGSDKHRGLLTMFSACPTREGRGGRCRREETITGRLSV